ncbi:MAG: hypothetical protein AMS24_02255 [Chlamydiae bacterium SM23_39]|nr:MAG: hypothetical protein AMS24_02255 [Chlamydiae bacterium SM23_39]
MKKNPSMKYKIAIIGATGLVGQELIKLLKDFPIKKLSCFASLKSKNKFIIFKNKKIEVQPLQKKIFKKNFDFIFFTAGEKISKKYIPLIKNKNCKIIDSSSYFRLKKEIPLIIPEINSHLIKKNNIISSPNCTTILMLLPIYPLHKKFKVKRIIASTYQAASGGGIKLLNKLKKETKEHFKKSNEYVFNLFLHDSKLNKKKYSEEEVKMEKESKKILNDKNIKISATCVRVPILRAHSLSLNIEFSKNISLKKIYEILKNSEGIKIFEDCKKNIFATPKIATNKDKIFVSRIRLDPTKKNTIWLWVVGDQLLKGAALNMYQIAKSLIL